MNSQFERFMKKNKVQKVEEIQYPATKSLLDASGKPLMWTLKKLTSEQTDKIRDGATKDVPVDGKKGMYRPKLDINKYLVDLVIASTVNPNLNDKELQDSYGVMDSKALLYAMVDDTGELGNLERTVQELCGIINIEDEIQEAKN